MKNSHLTNVLGSLLGGGLLLAASCSVDSSKYIFDDDAYDDALGNGTGGASTASGGGEPMGGSDPMGGADPGGTGGGSGADGPTAGDLRCTDKQVEFFAGGDLWVPLGGECEFLCVDGACTGDCEPNSTECVSSVEARSCSAEGAWEAKECDFACVEADNDCGGECVPGARQCSGKQKQLCDEQGAWQNDGDECEDACTDSGDGESAYCNSCEAGTTQCLNNRQEQACNAPNWGAITDCQFACVGDKCGGECIPNTSDCNNNKTARSICDSKGSWGPAATCDGQTCVATGEGEDRKSQCVGVCAPGDVRCEPKAGLTIQECENGQWVTQTSCKDHGEGFTCRPLSDGKKTTPICGTCTPGTPEAPVKQCHTTRDGNGAEQCVYNPKTGTASWVVQEQCGKDYCYQGGCYGTISAACKAASTAGQTKTTICNDTSSYYSCPVGIIVKPSSCPTDASCVYGYCEGGRTTTQ